MAIRTTLEFGARIASAALICAACNAGSGTDAGGADASAADGAAEGADAAPGHDASATEDAPSGRDAGDVRDAGDSRDASDGTDAASEAGAAIGIGGLRARLCTRTSYAAPLSGLGASPRAIQLGDSRFSFVEGPVWVDDQAALFFSDMNGPLSQIWRMDTSGSVTSFVGSSGSNGIALGPSGTLLAATHDTQSLSLYDLNTAARTNLSISRGGKHFNSPNDLVVRSDGTVYFTDPDWQLGNRTSEVNVTAAYRVPPPLAGSAAVSAESFEDGLDKPNGIALSPDERTLYLGSYGTEIWSYAVAGDGSLSGRTMFANPGGSDGMTVDCAGNVYIVTSGEVQVYAADGTKLGQIAVAENPTNVAFGGVDHQTLFITAQSHVYSIALAVPGFPY